MFSQDNFDAVSDGFNQSRKFYVHIPDDYDSVDGTTQKIPLIFAFHGGGQDRGAMIDGKWGDYFNQNIAFVIPLAETDPCDRNGPRQWMQPSLGPSSSAADASCDPATQVVVPGTIPPQTISYWNASLPGTFTDVKFVESLRAMILSRFPKLNANKVYATGFSSGGGMTLSLLCYRSELFRGYSTVAKMLYGASQRGDYNGDGVVDTDPNSLAATCGHTVFMGGHASGLATPSLWGYGQTGWVLDGPGGFPGPLKPEFKQIAKPIAVFGGDHDTTHYSLQDLNDTGDEIRKRNNLNGIFFVANPYADVNPDNATTQRRTFTTARDPAKPFSVFRRFWVERTTETGMPAAADHAMPDFEECAHVPMMTCDYSYTEETKRFFEDYADLNLNP